MLTLLAAINAVALLAGLKYLLGSAKENSKLHTLLKIQAEHNQVLQKEIEELSFKVDAEKAKANNILSQKKSSETRLGQISENLVPFLENFKYDPKTAHFLGSPLDYVIFDTSSEDPAVIFLEIKTGNSKLSSNQKTIKNLIKAGKVRFEEFRLDQKGQRVKITKNED